MTGNGFDLNAAIVSSIGRPIKADSSWLLIVDSCYLPDDKLENLTEEFGAVIVQMGCAFGGGNFYAESADNGISIEHGTGGVDG